MEKRAFLPQHTHEVQISNKPAIFLAELLAHHGVQIGETADARTIPVFVPDPVLSLFNATLAHPTMILLSSAYNVFSRKPENLSPEYSDLFDVIRTRITADTAIRVGDHYKTHHDSGLRRDAEKLLRKGKINDQRAKSKAVLEERVRSKVEEALSATRELLEGKEHIESISGELAS